MTSSKRLELSRKNVKFEEREKERIQQNVKLLESRVEHAGKPLVQEQLVRNELLYQKEGEVVIKLPEIEIEESDTLAAPKEESWQKWLELVSPQFLGK